MSSTEAKLTKQKFDEQFRLRACREERLVNCASCVHLVGETDPKKGTAFCHHPERLKRVKIAEYHKGFWGEKGESENISSERVCDAYANRPLPEGIVVPDIPQGYAALLNTQ